MIFRKFYYPADAYNKSKLAQVLFTNHLQALLSQNGLKMQTNSLHPGVVDTDLFANSSTDYIPWFRTLMFKVSVIKFIQSIQWVHVIKGQQMRVIDWSRTDYH